MPREEQHLGRHMIIFLALNLQFLPLKVTSWAVHGFYAISPAKCSLSLFPCMLFMTSPSHPFQMLQEKTHQLLLKLLFHFHPVFDRSRELLCHSTVIFSAPRTLKVIISASRLTNQRVAGKWVFTSPGNFTISSQVTPTPKGQSQALTGLAGARETPWKAAPRAPQRQLRAAHPARQTGTRQEPLRALQPHTPQHPREPVPWPPVPTRLSARAGGCVRNTRLDTGATWYPPAAHLLLPVSAPQWNAPPTPLTAPAAGLQVPLQECCFHRNSGSTGVAALLVLWGKGWQQECLMC